MVVPVCTPNTQEADAGASQFPDQFGAHNKKLSQKILFKTSYKLLSSHSLGGHKVIPFLTT
jgi:hypothetical protein